MATVSTKVNNVTTTNPTSTTTTGHPLNILPLIDSTLAESDSSDSESISSTSHCSQCCAECCAASIGNTQERIGNYFLEETLHKSEFGKIKLGIHTDSQQKFAIDVIKRNKVGEKISSVNQQIDILSSLKHPNIIKLIDTINTTKRIGIVLEYASGGDLFEYVLSRHSLEEEEAAKLFAQLINSVKYMHLKGVVHRDLKLENILFSDQEKTKLIVTNFGFANNEKKDLLSTSCGSPTYAAPELVFLETNGYHGPTADIWSCGVILYCMLCGYLPYDDDPENPESQNFHQLYRYIRTSTLSFPPYVSDKAQDLLRGMLHPDPSKRCTMDFITHHPWLSLYHDELLNQFNIDALESQTLEIIQQLRPVDHHYNHGNNNDQERMDTHTNHIQHDHEHDHSTQNNKQEENTQISTPSTSSSASSSNTPASPSINEVEEKASNILTHGNTNLNADYITSTTKDLPDILPPLPPVPNENESIVNDSGITDGPQQRQPSLRRQKRFKSGKKEDKKKKEIDDKEEEEEEDGDDHSIAHGIIDNEEEDDIKTTRTETVTTVDKEKDTKNEATQNDKNTSHTIHQLKSNSVPLLNNHSQELKIPTENNNNNNTNNNNENNNNSTNDNEGEEQDEEKDNKAATKKRRHRTLSALLFNPNSHYHRRTQSTHLLSSSTSTSPKTPKDQIIVDTSKSTTIKDNNNDKVKRSKTVAGSLKAWIKKKKSGSTKPLGERGLSPVSPPSSSTSTVSTTLEIAVKPQQSLSPSEANSTVTTPLEKQQMKTLTATSRDCLTKLTPSLLILSLMRILSALGIENQLKSTYQIACVRPSDHKNQKITKKTDPSLYKEAPIYGPSSLDKGHHVDFMVEICHSPIPDMFAIDFQLTHGEKTAFQFIKAKILTLSDLQSSII